MYNLVKPFDYNATKNRIKPQMQKFLQENLTADVPKPMELADRCAVDLTDYIEIMVECHGQESRGASAELYGARLHLGHSALPGSSRTIGSIRGSLWHERFCSMNSAVAESANVTATLPMTARTIEEVWL